MSKKFASTLAAVFLAYFFAGIALQAPQLWLAAGAGLALEALVALYHIEFGGDHD